MHLPQAWGSEFAPRNPHIGKKEPVPGNCLLTNTHIHTMRVLPLSQSPYFLCNFKIKKKRKLLKLILVAEEAWPVYLVVISSPWRWWFPSNVCVNSRNQDISDLEITDKLHKHTCMHTVSFTVHPNLGFIKSSLRMCGKCFLYHLRSSLIPFIPGQSFSEW